ncbi:MAG: hypothetical protein LBK53_07030 [Heliobacteriaceae bacterium]|jgi:hypothetical protein|nr:hypothetical protein [Heliobacteriaceae bacterium]
MGLAASQTRFLAITARKAGCEFESMRIAQEKLSVTRDMQRATEKYNNSMSATKLVWTMGGTGTNGIKTDLTYDVLTTPSALNDFTPILITSQTGKVVVSPAMARALEMAGISREGGTTPKEGGLMSDGVTLLPGTRNKFLTGLAATGVLSPMVLDKILKSKAKTYSNVGIGSKPLDKTSAFTLNINNLLTYTEQVLKSKTTKKTSEGTALTSTQQTAVDALADKLKFTLTATAGDWKDHYVSVNGSKSNTANVTLKDLIGKKVEMQNGDAAAFVNQLHELFSLIFTEDTQENATQALSYAKQMTQSMVPAAGQPVNLTNLTKSFLTYYAQAMGGYNSGYGINRNDFNKSNLVTDDLHYQYIIKNAYNQDLYSTEEALMHADFYNAMYNNICLSGWTTIDGADVKDKSYLTHALKNGQLFLSSMHGDGNYYQGEYTRNGFVKEVTDEDAVARAEAEFNKAKLKLNYKEELLDVNLKNVDMEISSLTAEYDSVKGLIGKNVEKAFSMFQ